MAIHFPKPEIQFFPAKENQDYNGFSILIPSWNNLEMLKFCVESVRQNSFYQHQIIVHINEGTDGSLDWVKDMNLDYSFSKENAGVCYAMNALATLSKLPYLLYLNDDMYVCKNWDKPLMSKALEFKHSLWYISGTMIEPLPSSSKNVVAPFDFGRSPSTFQKEKLDAFAAGLTFEDWSGASWPPSLIPKDTFLSVGGYSEEFSPGMYSDPDFSMKLWNAGVRVFLGLGNALVYHFRSHSTGRVKKNDGRKQFAAKWGIPASWFYKKVLKMGNPAIANQNLNLPKGFSYLIARIRAIYIKK